MQEISREYIENIRDICDYENIYLILTEDDKVFLRADIKNEDDLRIEMMYFEMDTSLSFSDANLDSRNCKGKIYFIEYDNRENAERDIFKDFFNIGANPIYLMCKDDDLGNILQQYKNRAIYVYIHDTFKGGKLNARIK